LIRWGPVRGLLVADAGAGWAERKYARSSDQTCRAEFGCAFSTNSNIAALPNSPTVRYVFRE
jgi:type IV pilus biogenesis protein CpaD/CtpE